MYNHPDFYLPKQRIVIDITENNGYLVLCEGKVFSCNDEKHLLSFLKEQMFIKTEKEGEANVGVNL